MSSACIACCDQKNNMKDIHVKSLPIKGCSQQCPGYSFTQDTPATLNACPPTVVIGVLVSLGLRRFRRTRADSKGQGSRGPMDVVAVGEARVGLDGSHDTYLELISLKTSRVLPSYMENSE